ncbi:MULTISPECIES: DUF1272 domain-containing protein [Pseudomonas]|uniref:DUF1272 domain-containing protein n=1 Tax=Pseudomonas TaxID=286 RepID=UPI001F02498D|nr:MULTISPECIES: DUF1272 domain-containing protein [Pseudomonas]MCG8294738.1 DUF1272 domain-containing protein [Pseudomonas entomophila]
MLELRPNCECCNSDLPAESPDALICSFECTFCRACNEQHFHNQCPNCGGQLVSRPTRTGKALGNNPASTLRVVKKHAACA